MITPLLYTAELDLAEADIEPFKQWYAYRHAPDVYQCGMLTCTCYLVEGGEMNLFDLYELPAWDLFQSPRYKEMGGRDPYMAALMEKRRNKAHTVYDQRLLDPDPGDGWLNADWISVARFDIPPAQDADVDAVSGAAMLALGAQRVRVAYRGKDHPRNPTNRPRTMVVFEWEEKPIPQIDLAKMFDARFGKAVTNMDTFIGQRIYPWPDRPA